MGIECKCRYSGGAAWLGLASEGWGEALTTLFGVCLSGGD